MCAARECSMVSAILKPLSAQVLCCINPAVLFSNNEYFLNSHPSVPGGGSQAFERRELSYQRNGYWSLIALALATRSLDIMGSVMRRPGWQSVRLSNRER